MPNHWYVSPTGSDAATGADALHPWKTFERLIDAAGSYVGNRLETGDTVDLEPSSAFDEAFLLQDGLNLGRDVLNVTLNGANASITSGSGDVFTATSMGWVIQDLVVVRSGSRTSGSGASMLLGPDCIVRRCRITGIDALVSNDVAYDPTGENQYTGSLLFEDNTILASETGINTGSSPTIINRCRVTNDQWDTCQSWSIYGPTARTIINNSTIENFGGTGASEHEALITTATGEGVDVTICGCVVQFAGRVTPTGAYLLKPPVASTLGILRVISSRVYGPQDVSGITITNSYIVDSTFTTTNGGAGPTLTFDGMATGWIASSSLGNGGIGLGL